MNSNIPETYFDRSELEAAAAQSLALGGFFDPPVVRRDGENYQVVSGHFEFHAAALARQIDPQAGEIIPAFVLESEIPQISKTVAVDRESLATLNREIGD
jgi:ParB family chromosome partitioning protein